MPSPTYEVKTVIFEGPMDLLVHLIKKAEVDIYDIPIALITDQFLAYLDWMKSMNIDFAGDFLLMAATLIHIKSRMLLPAHTDENEDEEDPRMEITRPLLEYLQIKSAAKELTGKNILGEDTFTRSTGKNEISIDYDNRVIRVGLFELIEAFKNILDNMSEEHKVDFTTDRISVKDRITEIIDILEEKRSVTFSELISGNPDRTEIIVSFLALLEMAKLNLLTIVQHVQSGIVRLMYI